MEATMLKRRSADILDRVYDLLADDKRWTTGTTARRADGEPIYSTSPHAVCWCLTGALAKECGEEGGYMFAVVRNDLMDTLKLDGMYSVSIPAFNDTGTHQMVLDLVRKTADRVRR